MYHRFSNENTKELGTLTVFLASPSPQFWAKLANRHSFETVYFQSSLARFSNIKRRSRVFLIFS